VKIITQKRIFIAVANHDLLKLHLLLLLYRFLRKIYMCYDHIDSELKVCYSNWLT